MYRDMEGRGAGGREADEEARGRRPRGEVAWEEADARAEAWLVVRAWRSWRAPTSACPDERACG